MSAHIHHIGIAASDLKRSAKFWRLILLEMDYRHHDTNEKRASWVGDRDEVLVYQAVHASASYDRKAPGLQHVAFGVENRERVDAIYKIVQKAGVEILDEPREFPEYSPGYYGTFFLDPDGMKIEVAHIP